MKVGSQLRANPPLVLLCMAVGAGLGGGVFMMSHILRNDPTVVLANKKNNPHPWLHVGQDRNLKLYSVKQKFEKSERPSY
ncbi:hypothetical protein HDU88_005069 [Geranomyces variabilis]|nr:hypothetical protein BDZ88DRAFT_408592 [Geranomyces variabilis]KAJ3164857.1 hypothetical protein HDU88_005069 [Geranomyces variabilis]